MPETTIVSTRSLVMNEEIIRNGMQTFVDVGHALLEIRDGKQYIDAGFDSFEAYCLERWDMDRSYAYRLIDASAVVHQLKDANIEVLPTSESQARPLAQLSAERRTEAWTEAVRKAPKGRITAGIVQTIVDKLTRRKPKPAAKSAGWTKDDLKDDEELSAAFGKLEKIWGRQDAEAIRKGAVERMNRKDVLALVNLPRETTDKIHDLVMGNHWTPAEAIAFVNDMPDESSTVEDLMNWCLATKGKYETFDINGFHLAVKYVGKAR